MDKYNRFFISDITIWCRRLQAEDQSEARETLLAGEGTVALTHAEDFNGDIINSRSLC
jgi:hypothetical protein